VAPLFVFPPLGLSGPLFVFALVACIVLALLILRLPDDTPRGPARGQIASYPAIGGVEGAVPDQDPQAIRLRWRDPRVLPWHIVGIVGGHGQAALLGVIGFLVIDRLHVVLDQAQEWIAVVLMSGAAASLLAQWGLIPRLRLDPRQLVVWGSLLAAAGAAITGLGQGIYTITLGFALASLGFGLYRPGFTSGASLAVEQGEQNAVAGMVTSINGLAYIAAPALGVMLYQVGHSFPFLVVGAVMLGLAAWTGLRRPEIVAEA